MNDFPLPGNVWKTTDEGNKARWRSFRDLYAGVPSGQRFDIETLKAITGYPGPDGDGVMANGAIFNSEGQLQQTTAADSTVQSILMDMSTMELWIHFTPPTAPRARPALRPTYRKIANPIY